jgi:hypothetical protein
MSKNLITHIFVRLKKKVIPLLFICGLAAWSSCTTQRIVKPLDRGTSQVQANFGGPLIGFAGTTIPIPLTSVGYAYGVTDSLTIHTGLQLTNIAYQNLHYDVGATYGFLKPNGWAPGISSSISLNYLRDFRQGNQRIYPQLDANLFWDYGERHFMYLGTTNWIEMSSNLAHNEPIESRFLSGIQFGNTFSTPKWNYTIESKWLAPTRNSNDLTVDYKTYSIGGERKGAVGLYFGISRNF